MTMQNRQKSNAKQTNETSTKLLNFEYIYTRPYLFIFAHSKIWRFADLPPFLLVHSLTFIHP